MSEEPRIIQFRAKPDVEARIAKLKDALGFESEAAVIRWALIKAEELWIAKTITQ